MAFIPLQFWEIDLGVVVQSLYGSRKENLKRAHSINETIA